MSKKKHTIGSDRLAKTIRNFTEKNIGRGERAVKSVPLPKTRR